MKLQRILVLDDESLVRSVTSDLLRENGYSVLAVSSARQARTALQDEDFDLVLSDIRLEGEDGLQFLAQVRDLYPNLPLMLMTGFGSLESAVQAIRLGVLEYLLKPIDPEHLYRAIERLEEKLTLQAENRYLRKQGMEERSGETFWGKSAPMQQVLRSIDKISRTDATVLIRGESGTGKEVVARALHSKGHRAKQPFIKVNCAAIPANLLESEFFGHEKGAFTGANQRRQGRFELADEGTLLLDEISEIPPDLQVKLLRVLQEREFERVGGNQTLKVDTNIIATTNRNLEEDVRNGRFREDLYYRLNVVPISLPPLRERGDDLIEMARFFYEKLARKHGKKVHAFSAEVLTRLRAYDWPGNVRELQNAIERAVILSDMEEGVRADDLVVLADVADSKKERSGVQTLAELEQETIFHALEWFDQNRTHTAKALGISLRTLRNKLKQYREAKEDD